MDVLGELTDLSSGRDLAGALAQVRVAAAYIGCDKEIDSLCEGCLGKRVKTVNCYTLRLLW